MRDARRLTVQIVEGVEAELPALISTDSVAAFRAVRAKADIDGDAIYDLAITIQGVTLLPPDHTA